MSELKFCPKCGTLMRTAKYPHGTGFICPACGYIEPPPASTTTRKASSSKRFQREKKTSIQEIAMAKLHSSTVQKKNTLNQILSNYQQYWLLVTSRINYNICVSHGLWGVEHAKDLIKNTQIGDIVFFYIRKEYFIKGPFAIASNVFYDKNPVWPDRKKVYPWRFKIVQLYDSVLKVYIRGILNELNFIENPDNWGRYLQREMILLDEEDGQTILMHLL